MKWIQNNLSYVCLIIDLHLMSCIGLETFNILFYFLPCYLHILSGTFERTLLPRLHWFSASQLTQVICDILNRLSVKKAVCSLMTTLNPLLLPQLTIIAKLIHVSFHHWPYHVVTVILCVKKCKPECVRNPFHLHDDSGEIAEKDGVM